MKDRFCKKRVSFCLSKNRVYKYNSDTAPINYKMVQKNSSKSLFKTPTLRTKIYSIIMTIKNNLNIFRISLIIIIVLALSLLFI